MSDFDHEPTAGDAESMRRARYAAPPAPPAPAAEPTAAEERSSTTCEASRTEARQPTNREDAAAGNINAIRHVAYAEGYADGKKSAQEKAWPVVSYGLACELWAAAQLAPGEGIEDGAARIEAILQQQRAVPSKKTVAAKETGNGSF